MRQLPTDRRAQRRQATDEAFPAATSTDGPELIELQEVAERTSKAPLATALAVGAGVVLIAGLLISRSGSSGPATAIASPTIAATLEASATPVPTPPPSPTPASPPGTPGPFITPNYPSWRWEPISIAPLESQQARIVDMWLLPELFVAAGHTRKQVGEDLTLTPIIVASPDGRSWSSVPLPRADFRPEAGVVFDGALWMIGYRGGEPSEIVDATRTLWRTTDGKAWTRIGPVEGLFEGAGAVIALEVRPTGWLAVVTELVGGVPGGSSSRLGIRRSLDGSHWRAASIPDLPDGSEVIDIATDGSRWVVAVLSEEVEPGVSSISALTSDDGSTWALHQVARLVGQGRDLAWRPDGFVIVGGEAGPEGYEPRAWKSVDGVAWTERTVGTYEGLVPVEMTGVIPTGRGYLAISDANGQAWVSADGESWENFEVFTNAAPSIHAVAVRGDLIVATSASAFNGYVALVGNLEGMHH